MRCICSDKLPGIIGLANVWGNHYLVINPDACVKITLLLNALFDQPLVLLDRCQKTELIR